jgi:intracellular multiplication protein IcmL
VGAPRAAAKTTGQKSGLPAKPAVGGAASSLLIKDGPIDPLANILNRNEFYRDGYRLLMKIALIEGMIIAALIACIVGLFLFVSPKDRFFATTMDGRIISLVPLDVEYQSPGEVVAWSAKVARDVMTFGYHDYRDRLQENAAYFTPRGWESFTQALTKARILEAIETRRQVVTATIEGAPEIRDKGVANGVYRWIVRIPMTVNYRAEQNPVATPMMLTLVLVRVSTLENPKGIGIEQWIADPRQVTR